jgi:hypothetical protein
VFGGRRTFLGTPKLQEGGNIYPSDFLLSLIRVVCSVPPVTPINRTRIFLTPGCVTFTKLIAEAADAALFTACLTVIAIYSSVTV